MLMLQLYCRCSIDGETLRQIRDYDGLVFYPKGIARKQFFAVPDTRLFHKPNSGRAKLLIARFVTGLCIVAIFGFLAFSVFNIFRPHLVDGWLMNAVGARANAVVTNVEATNNRHNKNTVMRHDILFKTADGTPVETYFHTWDFNIYPSASSVRYPQQGQQFRVLYLPSYPTTFLILTEEDSPYSKQNDCGDLIKALEAAKIKHDFDPKDPKFKAALDEAAKKVIDAKCGTTTVDGNAF